MNVRRRRSDYRDDPPPSRVASRRKAPPRRKARQKQGAAVSVAKGFYKAIVVLSALIVAVYAGFTLMVRPPEQKQPPQPPQTQPGISLGPNFGAGSNTGTANPAVPAEPALNRREGVYNILLAGTDKDGYRTDTMMVMCYDTVKQTVGVVSVPRDTLVARPDEHVHLAYGKGGVEQRVEDISDMLGIPIDGYIKVNLKGFVSLVDYLKGVDIEVPVDMNYDDPTPGQDLHIHFKKGMQHLNGQQAMEVARYRHDNKDSPNYRANQWYSDVQRTQTQQKILIALAKKVLAWDSITKINGFVEIFNKNVTTDLTLNEMLYFAGQAMGVDPSSAIETATLEGNGFGQYRNKSKTYRYCYELDPEKAVETVNRLINPYDRDLTLKDMNIAKADSYHD